MSHDRGDRIGLGLQAIFGPDAASHRAASPAITRVPAKRAYPEPAVTVAGPAARLAPVAAGVLALIAAAVLGRGLARGR